MARRKGKEIADEAFQVLYHLSRVGIIPKSDLSLVRGNPKDCYAQRLIAAHIEAGRIKTIRHHNRSYCFVSESGIEYLCKQERDMYICSDVMYDYQDFIQSDLENESSQDDLLHWEPSERKPTRKMNPQKRMKLERMMRGTLSDSFKAEIRKNSAMNLMYCTGVQVYQEDKPDFKTFLAILSQPSYTTTFLWQVISSYGVYYSREEMSADDGGYQGRMIGVLFTRAGWYVVYNAYEERSRWFDKLEELDTGKLSSILKRLLPYRSSHPRSLVFAIGRGMVASMVNGYKYGHNRSKNALKGRASNWQKKLMTVETMKVLYETVYLVGLNSSGIGSLAWLILSDEKMITEERQTLVSRNPEFFRFEKTVSGQSIVVERSSGREVVLSPIYNLTELKRKRDGSAPVTYIGPPSMADAVSKSLGPRLGTYISAYGDGEIAVNRYDEFGEKILS